MDGVPDIEMGASVHADEITFECVPSVSVVAWSNLPAVAERVRERGNLPDEVDAGVTYRDVTARWWVGLRIDDPELPSA